MNKHLIKNHRLWIVFTFLKYVCFLVIFYYLVSKNIDWYLIILLSIYPIYSLLKNEKIILEINNSDEEVIISYYSILMGQKELSINLDQIIEIDFYKGLIIKYKSSLGKIIQTYRINAEPWNNLYGQIKDLKLAFQEFQATKEEIKLRN
jgi:hypothetical protein|tara:strand:- start:488 stop:934 length:447 start_codon:yes stop_codon:yes gene_type:complete